MSAATNGMKVNSEWIVRRIPDENGSATRSGPLWPEHPAQETGDPWRFVLIVEPAPSAQREGRLPIALTPLAARLLGPGATLLEEPCSPVVRIRFDWPASTQAAAVAAAICAVESYELRVLRVDNDDHVTAGDVAHRIGMSREAVRLWAARLAGPGGFPPPVNPRRDTTFYAWSEVLPWLRERKGLDLPEEEPALVAANLAVRLRALLPRLAHPKAILDLLHEPLDRVPAARS